MSEIEEVLGTLRAAGIDFVSIIPCVSIKDLICAIEDHFPTYAVTRGEEAVGLCAGAHFAGRRPALVMQNSGLGNSINALKSLIELYKIPLLLIMSQRGHEKEWIKGQVPMGQATEGLLNALGISYSYPEKGGVAAAVQEAVDISRERGRAAAVLIVPGVIS